MATNTLSILKPSVNNMTVRVLARAAGLDFEELDVWGKKSTPEFLSKDPADLTPLLEEAGLPKGSLWESCAIMQYLCNTHGLDSFYPTDPGERAMVDSAMFYLVGTIYPLLARATYPALGFGQYPGEVATADVDDGTKAAAQQAADPIGSALRDYAGTRRELQGGYQKALPSIHLTHDLAANWKARLSWSNSFGRPALNSLLPNETVNETAQTLTVNNPSLLPQSARNWDASLDYYFEPVGNVSVGFFQKTITDFIVRNINIGTVAAGMQTVMMAPTAMDRPTFEPSTAE